MVNKNPAWGLFFPPPLGGGGGGGGKKASSKQPPPTPPCQGGELKKQVKTLQVRGKSLPIPLTGREYGYIIFLYKNLTEVAHDISGQSKYRNKKSREGILERGQKKRQKGRNRGRGNSRDRQSPL